MLDGAGDVAGDTGPVVGPGVVMSALTTLIRSSGLKCVPTHLESTENLPVKATDGVRKVAAYCVKLPPKDSSMAPFSSNKLSPDNKKKKKKHSLLAHAVDIHLFSRPTYFTQWFGFYA